MSTHKGPPLNARIAGAQTLTAGATAAAVAQRFGATDTEGAEIRVIDETVTLTNAASTDLTNVVPAGAVILSAQANLETLVVGDASGDDGLVKVGLGTSGDPDKYGLTADLTKNAKIDTVPDWAVLASSEQLGLYAVDTSGDAVTEKYVGGETVRVRVVFLALNSLDDAP